MENNDEVDMEFYLEEWVTKGGTWVNLREQHVEWDLQAWNHISISNLNVLDLGGISFALESLNTYELDFYRLNLKFRVLTD